MKFSAKSFADYAGISEKLASRILEMVYEKELSAEDFSSVLWKLRNWFIENKMPALIEKLKDEEIGSVIDQIIVERSMWQSQCPRDMYSAKTSEELEQAFNNLKTPEAAWFFTALSFKDKTKHKAGDTVRVQIMRTGKWQHPSYGEVEISKKTIKDVVKNFKNRERGVDLAVDENHEPDHKALAWFKELIVENEGNDLFADVELTQKGADLLNEGAYKYFSPEIVFHKIDEESGDPQSNLLIGGAFTNRPFFKNMVPLMASEGATAGVQSGQSSATEGHAVFFSHSSTMKKFLELMARLVEKTTITASEKAELETAYGELPKEDRSDDINTAFAETVAKFDEEEKPVVPADETPEQKAAREAAEGEEEGEEAEGEQAAQATEALDGITFNEDGSYKITDPAKFAESVKAQQKRLADLQRETSLVACEKLLAPMVFSDKRKDRVVKPAQKKMIVAFAASLDEKKRATFFSILGNLKAVPAGEIGHSKEKPAPDVTKPETFTEEDEVVKYFMEAPLHQDLKTAQKSAADFYKSRQ